MLADLQCREMVCCAVEAAKPWFQISRPEEETAFGDRVTLKALG